MALKTMPIAKLQQLKSQVEAAISAKVTERRRELETELSKLTGFGGGGKATKFARGGRMGPVAPKYRNPETPTETWAGRGLKPRWLTAAIKGGKKQDDFLIPSGPTQSHLAQSDRHHSACRPAPVIRFPTLPRPRKTRLVRSGPSWPSR
jgi:DNA-binding protein H-NS